MFNNKQLVSQAVNKIALAARHALDDLALGRVQQEPALTDRFVAYVQSELNGRSLAGIQWSAVTLPDRGANSAESQIGADLLSVVQFNLPGFAVTKGFLAQAKLVEPSTTFPGTESQRLRNQCDKMLDVSPASYVFLYSEHSGIRVVPAIELTGSRDCNPHELTSRSISQFFTEHFECFIGDRRFREATRKGLDILREEYRARKVLFLKAQPGEGAREF